MPEREDLPDEELSLLAEEWRRRALEGDRHARGIAHQFEAELRRRNGALHTSYDTLDMRSIESKVAGPWWQFWRT